MEPSAPATEHSRSEQVASGDGDAVLADGASTTETVAPDPVSGDGERSVRPDMGSATPAIDGEDEQAGDLASEVAPTDVGKSPHEFGDPAGEEELAPDGVASESRAQSEFLGFPEALDASTGQRASAIGPLGDAPQPVTEEPPDVVEPVTSNDVSTRTGDQVVAEEITADAPADGAGLKAPPSDPSGGTGEPSAESEDGPPKKVSSDGETGGAHATPAFCTSCGRRFSGEEARFCGGCGAPRGDSPAAAAAPLIPVAQAPSPATRTVPTQQAPTRSAGPEPSGPGTLPGPGSAPRPVPEWQTSLPGPFNSIPPELLLVCALMAAAGVLTLWPVVKTLPDIFDLLGASGFARSFGLLLLTVWLALGFFGVACLLLAWRMAHADRVARGLSYVLLGGLGGAILVGNEHQTTLTLVMLASFGAIAILAAAPAVQRFFVAEGSPQGDQPTPVVIARTLVAVWAGFLTLVGLMFLPISAVGSKYVVVGALFLAIGVGGFIFNKHLATGDENARLIVTVGCVVYPILLLVLGQRDPSLLLPIALVAGIAWNLWIPNDSKQFFGSRPPSF